MVRTRKVQVTLDEEQYEDLAEIARRDGRKLASVVRESIEKYALAPEAERSKRDALRELFSMEPAPAPPDYREWKREYGADKAKAKTKAKA